MREDLPIATNLENRLYDRYLKLAKISNVLTTEVVLKNLNCAAFVNAKWYFTNAGALFFRKNDEDVVFRHAGIVCALYKGTNKAYILDAKELNRDIISNVDDAIVFLKKHLRMSFIIKSLKRENILEVPESALREAVVNAVCHRDYFEKGARVMVEIYDNRVEVVSPGGLCKGITPDNFGTVSITRNALVASMLYRVNYIEQMGTGIERMRIATQEAEVAEPEFEFSTFFKVIFKRPISEEVPQVRSKSTQNERALHELLGGLLSASEIQKISPIVDILARNGSITPQEAQSAIAKSPSTTRRYLSQLREKGVVAVEGKANKTRYVLKGVS